MLWIITIKVFLDKFIYLQQKGKVKEMKNRLKKITAMLLSIGMLMTLCVGANVKAAEPETGSITIHKFKIKTQAEYNQFVNDQTKRGNGNEITDGSLDGLEVFPDITFTLTKIVDDGTKELKPSLSLIHI